jgi:bifunctional non-homologous end joining protein LigD
MRTHSAGDHSALPAGQRDLTLPAGFIAPCLPMTAPSPPSGADWVHEIADHGIRIIARKSDRRVVLYGAQGDVLTYHFPPIVEALSLLPSCTIDGEVVAGEASAVQTSDLQPSPEPTSQLILHAFDLIELDGDDLRREPLEWRKAELGRLIAHTDAHPGLLFKRAIDGAEFDGAAVFERACALSLAGIASKRKDARYVSGRSPYWLTMRNPAWEAGRLELEEGRGW